MDTTLFERLLYEEESTTLDFKREQYRFAKATEDERSELLKDILGFANAWRRAEAYILIGVEDVRGGRAIVLGIHDHLDDHSLQQFVSNLTSRPVRFHYEALGFESKQVGIIRIDEQPRPVYLKRDYGKLKKNDVYVRRGSSTDPTKPATPEEVAQMGTASGPQSAELVVEFADVERDDSLGQDVTWDAEFCVMPAMASIPDLVPPRQQHPWDLSTMGLTSQLNSDYFRELADYESARRLFRPVRLVVKNVGKVAANKVRVEITVPTDIGVTILDHSDLPYPPKHRRDLISPAVMTSIRPAILRSPGEVTIDQNDERFRVEIDCGDLQPGRRVWSEVFYIATRTSGAVAVSGQVFAENLPQPLDFSLVITVNVRDTVMSLEQLTSLPEPVDPDD